MGGNPIILTGLGSLPGIAAQVGTAQPKEDAVPAPGGTTPGATEPPALQCSATVSCTALPWTVTQFRATAQQRINDMNARIGVKNQQIASARGIIQSGDPGLVQQARGQIQSYQGQIAIFRLVIWLANRELGTPQPISTLISSLGGVGGGTAVRNEWNAQISMILVSELEDPDAAAALENIIGNSNNWRTATGLDRERLALELIHDRILTNSGSPRDELTLLIGENRLRLAMIAKNQGRDTDFRSLLSEARTFVSRLATLSNVSTTSHTDLLNATDNDQIADRRPYIRNSIETLGDDNYAALRHEFAWANVVMARILSLEGEAVTSSQQMLNNLQQAERYLRNTTVLPGIQRLAARRALADNLILQGHTLNNLGQDFSSRFGEALCILNGVIDFHETYAGTQGVTVVQRWLVNIVAQARTSRAAMLQSLVGELDMENAQGVLCLLAPEDAQDLQPGELTQQELDELRQGACENRVLQVQTRLLESLAQEFQAIRGLRYQYGTNPAFDLLNDQQIMNIRYLLGENLALRGFFAMALGEDETALMQQAATHLNAVISAPATQVTPLNRAMARLLLAKMREAEVGEDHNFAENNQILDQAEQLVQAALAADRLRGNLLRSAHETAFKIRLWRLELSLRQGESYAPVDITRLEELAFEILRSDHVTNDLIERTLKDLMEAYSVRKANHPRIVLIGNILLGRSFDPPDNAELTPLISSITALRTRINTSSRLELRDEFRALLYLRLAEAVSWAGRDQLDDADSILDELASTLPAEIAQTTGERKNRTLYLLLRAELQMRLTESADPVMSPALVQAVLDSREVDLITRLAYAQIEGLQQEGRGEFPTLIQLLRDLLTADRLQQIESLFGANRHKSYLQYRLRLWMELGRVLSWDEQYAEAQTELTDLLSDQALTDLADRDAGSADLIRTMARLNLGNILRYDWAGRDLTESRNNYEAIINGHLDLDQVTNPDLLVAIAEAHLGLADLDMMPGEARNLEAATEHLTQVREIARRLTDDPDKYHQLMAHSFLGMANLSRNGSGWGQADLEQVAQFIGSARHHLQQIADPPDYLESAIEAIYNDPHIRARIRPEITADMTMFSGGDRAETQLNLGFHLPISIIPGAESATWLHLTGREQIDFGPRGNIYSTYAGLRLMPHSSLTLNTEFRLYTGGDPGATMLFFRHQDVNLGLDYWSPGIQLGDGGNQLAISFGGQADVNYSGTDYNSYSGYAALNFLFTQTPVLERLSLGVQCGSYPFAFVGEARRMNSCAFGPSIELEATDWLSFSGNFMGLAYQTTDPNIEAPWQMGWQTGAGINFNLIRHLRFGANFWHQQTDFPINTVTGNAAVTF